ncbi:hypothetical protein HanPSC8_Chr14g0642521 [Helianthus annuus]|nr:hypothetical protein HanPSC8_Chr14g0642521 [Helianthus annuus]
MEEEQNMRKMVRLNLEVLDSKKPSCHVHHLFHLFILFCVHHLSSKYVI